MFNSCPLQEGRNWRQAKTFVRIEPYSESKFMLLPVSGPYDTVKCVETLTKFCIGERSKNDDLRSVGES